MEKQNFKVLEIEEKVRLCKYFDKSPNEKIRHKSNYNKLVQSVKKYFNNILSSLESRIGNEEVIGDKEYAAFRRIVDPLFGLSEDTFSDLHLRINSFIENYNLNRLSKTVKTLRHRYADLHKKLKDLSLDENERKALKQEFDKVSERLYYIDR